MTDATASDSSLSLGGTDPLEDSHHVNPMASGMPYPAVKVKQKKSLDWLSKGFKRKSSSSTSTSTSNASSSITGNTSTKGLGRASVVRSRSAHGHDCGSNGSPTKAIFSEPLLAIPGSPVLGYSSPSSLDGKSGDDDVSSAKSSAQATSSIGGDPGTPDSDIYTANTHLLANNTNKGPSPLPSPLPSPPVPPYNRLLDGKFRPTDDNTKHPSWELMDSIIHLNPLHLQENGLLQIMKSYYSVYQVEKLCDLCSRST